MHNLLVDAYIDRAAAHAGSRGRGTPEENEGLHARFLRSRFAIAGSYAAIALALVLGGWTNSGVIAVIVFVVLFTGLLLWVERPTRLRKLLRFWRLRE